MRQVAILGFHKVGDSPADWESWFYVPEATFAGYLHYLKENRWHVISLETLLRGLEAPDSLPEQSAVLTFDDGSRSVRDVALPWLVRLGFPSVMFVPSDFIGKVNSFDAGQEPEDPICNWEELRELQRCGMAVQSHGASHRAFSELEPAEQEAELLRSKRTLEAGLGEAVQVFSFPYGDCGSDSAAVHGALARSGYRAACLYGGGPNPLPIHAPYGLTRLAMGPDTDLKEELRSDRN